MNKNINKITLIIELFLVLGMGLSAQTFKESGINIGVKMGGAKLISEFSENQSVKEFTNKPGFAAGVEVSKILFPHIELGTEFNFSILNGDTDKTDHFSAIGFHTAFLELLSGPTEYNNKLISQNIFLRYYIGKVFRKTYINPFFKIGFGYLSYKSTFKYIENQEIIFGKGDENQANLSTGMFSIGTGIKTYVSQRFYLLTSLDFNLVNYDFLDVVHNYNDSGDRIKITGLYSEIKIGIFFNSGQSEIISGSTLGKGKKDKSLGGSKYLPFGR